MAAEPAGARDGHVVLYVDDKPENAALVRRILAHRPTVELRTAATGGDGVAAAATSPPDLVLLDLALPDMPGEEVLSRLRAADSTRDVPVVVVSAEAAPARIERLRGEGVRDYITMPYDVTRFLAVIDEVLGLA